MVMKTKQKQPQPPRAVMMRMHRLNRIDAQLTSLGNRNPPRRAALEKRRGMVYDTLAAALHSRIQTLEKKISNNTSNDTRRSALEQRLETFTKKKAMIDMPFEERIRACWDQPAGVGATNPHHRAQLALWMARSTMDTMSRDERMQWIQSKLDGSTTTEETELYTSVLHRMQNRRRRRPEGAPGTVEERIVRIQTRLENTNDATMRNELEHRLAKLQGRAGKASCTPDKKDARAHGGTRLGAMQGQRGCGGSLVQRIRRVEAKLAQATEASEVDRCTKRLDQLNQRFHNQAMSREERMLQLRTKLQNTENEDKRRRLQHRLDTMMNKNPDVGPHRRRRRRMRCMERRLASCTHPQQKEKIQARLDVLQQRSAAVADEMHMLGHQPVADENDDNIDGVIVDPAEAVEAMDNSA